MLTRNLYASLVEWRKSAQRKPLILRGARQVGKTHLLTQLGEKEYKNYIYLNFEKDPALKDFFVGRIDPKKILQNIAIYSEQKIQPETTLVILDEIQACPEALKSLKYFNEESNEFHVATAGSLLGVKIGQSAAFPVGKVNFMDLYPLTFFEFLSGVGASSLRDYLESISECAPLASPFHSRFTELLKLYFFIGGMPEAIVTYTRSQNLAEVRKVQKEILTGYENDFSKYSSPSNALKIAKIWDSIPLQLARDNKKFKYSDLNRSARAREYSEALKWLSDAGLVLICNRLETPQLPLDAHIEDESFKLYMIDCGLLGAKLNASQRTVVLGNELFQTYKGAYTENFVAQELIGSGLPKIYYWTSGNTAEVDFIVSYKEDVFPLEVKSGTNGNSPSLAQYAKKYKPKTVSIATLRNLLRTGNHVNFPLYAVSLFPKLVAPNDEPEQLEFLITRSKE